MSAVRAAQPTPTGRTGPAAFVPRWEVEDVDGAVVVVDVIRAFTTAACAFAAGADAIYLVATVEEALAFKHRTPGALAVGEVGGHRPGGTGLRPRDPDVRDHRDPPRPRHPAARGASRRPSVDARSGLTHISRGTGAAAPLSVSSTGAGR